MKINLVSSFAAGILISTAICSVVYFTNNGTVQIAKAPQNQVKAQPTENEMKSKLATAGYVVQTKADYDKSLNDAKAAAQKSAAPDNSQQQKPVTKVIVNVSEGMTSIDVGNTLQSAGLIQNAFDFSKDIENKGLENNLHPGTYNVDSSMSYDQIVSTIFH